MNIEDKKIPQEEKGNKTPTEEQGFTHNQKLDSFQRIILENNFENNLTMAKNKVKLNYSKIKNTILSYNNLKSNIEDTHEVFTRGKDVLFRIEVNENQTLLYIDLPAGSLNKKVYPHRTSKKYKENPILVTINQPASRVRGEELVKLAMDLKKIPLSKNIVYVPYAEKYPFDQNAVLQGKEHIPPKKGEFSGKEYEDINNELSTVIIEKEMGIITTSAKPKQKKKGREKLEDIRQTSTTIKGAMAIAEPIVYYYDVAVNKENNVGYVNVQQVLNDRFLGRILPPQFFAVAEGSARIEQFNFLALEAVRNDCDLYPNINFVVTVSSRLLIKKNNLKKLVNLGKVENQNLVFAFDCALLEALGDIGKRGITELKENGIKIMIDNSEQASMQMLTDYFVDYLRFDGRYYDQDKQSTVFHLEFLTEFAKKLGIITTVTHIENIKDALFFISKGVDVVEGHSVSKPKRLVRAAIKERKNLPLGG